MAQPVEHATLRTGQKKIRLRHHVVVVRTVNGCRLDVERVLGQARQPVVVRHHLMSVHAEADAREFAAAVGRAECHDAQHFVGTVAAQIASSCGS